jgi:OFA family oxalate/formate antiporter-like MFS transporter
MSDPSHTAAEIPNLGRRVTFAGLGINLALGVLYSWSVLSNAVPQSWEWSQTDRSLPFSVACLVFCLVMVPAGRMQDRFGPRLAASIGGLLVGLGMIVASFTTTPWGYIVGFGVLAGSGFGFGYASATPPAVKWFPAAKTGLIAGLVVSGFGLSSVYTAPLAQWLIANFGLPSAVLQLGIAFLIVVVLLAQLLKTPPPGYVPPGSIPRPATSGPARKDDYAPLEMIGTWQFAALWFMYACGSGAGLMIISKLANIAASQAGLKLGFLLVAALAIGNGAGRIIAGMASDRIGRKATLLACFLMQAVLIGLLSQTRQGSLLATTAVLAIVSALIGANYGANLALFPSLTKDYFGLKNFGINYGLVFTAWGVGGFLLAMLAGTVYDRTQSFNFAYGCSALLLVLAAMLTPVIRPPQALHE